MVADYHSEANEIKLIFASNLASSKCLFDTYQVFELYSRMTEIENVFDENCSLKLLKSVKSCMSENHIH